MRGRRTPTKAIQKALAAEDGCISGAAARLGVHRRTIERRLVRSPRLRSFRAELEEENLDRAEATLQRKIREGNLTAVIFYLKTKGRRRGYAQHLDLREDGAPGTAPDPARRAMDILPSLSDEARAHLRALLAELGARSRLVPIDSQP
jgi:hypothetical protein